MTGAVSALVGFFLLAPQPGLAQADAQEPPPLPSYQVALTTYNAVPAQTDSDPFETASGAYSNPQVIAARSVDLSDKLPFGTVISIDPATTTPACGYEFAASMIGFRVIEDSMNARLHDRVDVLLPLVSADIGGGRMMNVADAFGICHGVTIHVLGHIAFDQIPKTQKQLIAMIASGEVVSDQSDGRVASAK